MEEFVLWMDHIPDLALYITLSIGAAIENFIPPVPADTFIAIGGLLAGAGDLDALWVFGGAWFCTCLLYTSPIPRDQRGSSNPASD